MGKVLASKYNVRKSHRLGFGEHCTKTTTDLNRVVVLGESEGRRFVQIESHARHVELISVELSTGAGNQSHGRPN